MTTIYIFIFFLPKIFEMICIEIWSYLMKKFDIGGKQIKLHLNFDNSFKRFDDIH